MGDLFNPDNRIMNVLDKIMNTVILNICFLIGCLPVVTVGASLTALYTVNLKMVRDEESHVFSSFWKAFRTNFKQSTLCWLIMVSIGVVFIADFKIVGVLEGAAEQIFSVTTLVLFIIYLIVLMYVFPYMARFSDKLGICMKNALMIGGTNIGCTIAVFMVTAACVALTIYSPAFFLRALFIWIVGGFSLLAYVNSHFFRKIFERYE